MGGIAIDPGGGDEYIPNSQCSMLTADGILFLLEHGPQLLPDISEDDVKDKSKGGSVTKFFGLCTGTLVLSIMHRADIATLTYEHARAQHFRTRVLYAHCIHSLMGKAAGH